MLLGPVCAGVLITVLSAPAVLVVDAATFATSLALVGLFVERRRAPVHAEPAASARAGIRFLVRDRLLRVWVLVFAIGDSAWTAFFVAVPVLVVARFGADARVAGWLVASFGIGALIGNGLAYRFLAERARGISVIAAGVMGQALPLWLLTIHFPRGRVLGGARRLRDRERHRQPADPHDPHPARAEGAAPRARLPR